MNSLVWLQIEHQLSCSVVLFDVPGLLFFGWSAGARLFAIDESPQAFGAQEGLHLFAPGSVVVAIERLNAVIMLLRGHGWEWSRNGASRKVDVAEFRIGENKVALNARRKREFRMQGS